MSSQLEKGPIIVSACLAGINCRYDCAAKSAPDIVKMVEEGLAIPLCPEQLGGLPTPRPPAEQIGDKVITIDGVDVTAQYQKGVEEAIKVVEMTAAKKVYLKSKSPMCGVGQIYDGTFKGQLKPGEGLFARALKKLGVMIEEVD